MDKAQLLAPRSSTDSGMPEDRVEVAGVGEITVRGLTRYEVMLMRKATDSENIEGSRALVLEQKLLSMAMVEPAMSEEDVKQWQKISLAGELQPVVQRVQELSGMTDDATKSGPEKAGE